MLNILKQYGVRDSFFKPVTADSDFINNSGLIFNDMDEQYIIKKNNAQVENMYLAQKEAQDLLIRMCSNDFSLSHLLNDQQEFWVSFCSSAQDNTIYPDVFNFQAIAHKHYIYYPQEEIYIFEEETNNLCAETPIGIQDDIWEHLCSSRDITDATVEPKNYEWEYFSRKAGIFYSECDALNCFYFLIS